ncbi:hypothetical protein QBC38DRAFT_119986 [Podospora fimiseda]|uniref:Clr5 domain-containing protein n=1 Tax=Podospora fimiseda TaxID=252190 RepID=A0AAN7H2S0_9PEZI|nr:hypothetical protein QBC38DRAFT_119986 [Podospora fimiseda]
MEKSMSPDAGPMALLVSAGNMTGLVLDNDEIDAFIKREDTTPGPDDKDRSLVPVRISTLKFKNGGGSPTDVKVPPRTGETSQQQHHHHNHRPVKTGKGRSKISTRGPHSTPNAIIPRRVEDWEPWKSVLFNLYITQNRILRDIIEYMDTTFNLKATPKMYKNQFARWNFFKYSVKRRTSSAKSASLSSASASASEPAKDDFDDDTILMDMDSRIEDSPLSPTFHESRESRSIQYGLTAVNRFLRGHVDKDAANLQMDEVTGYIDPCYRYFKVAIDLFDLQENMEGGRVLRLAFLQIDRKLSTPTMKTFSDLCVLVPHLLLESGRREILEAYLQYLRRLAHVKYGKHPITEIAASFSDLLNRPQNTMGYIKLLSKAHADTICKMDGVLDRNRQWASQQHLACEKTKDPPGWPFNRMERTNDEHHMIRLEAQSVYWAQNLIMRDQESDDLGQQWFQKRFEPRFAERTEALLDKVKYLETAGLLPKVFSSMMEALFVGWLNDYYETIGDVDNSIKWGRRGLALSSNEQFVLWSIHLENLMRAHGRDAEADELKVKRRALDWMETVREQVDKMTLGP